MTSPVPPAARARQLPRWAGYVLLATAAVYLLWILHRQWPAVAAALLAQPPRNLLLALIAAMVMLAMEAVYHVLLLRRWTGPASGWRQLAVSYFLGQLVRYLPGKVLGLLYQAHHLGGAAAVPAVFVTNVVQFAYTSAVTAGMACAIAAAYLAGTAAAAAVLLLLFAGVVLSHRLALAERLLRWAGTLWSPLRRVLDAGPPASRDTGFALGASALLLLEWIPYVIGWALLLPADTPLADAALAGVIYAGASFVAALAIIAPSGLVVREAVFIWLGTRVSLDAAQLLALGLVVRLLYTAAELLLAALLTGIATLHARRR